MASPTNIGFRQDSTPNCTQYTIRLNEMLRPIEIDENSLLDNNTPHNQQYNFDLNTDYVEKKSTPGRGVYEQRRKNSISKYFKVPHSPSNQSPNGTERNSFYLLEKMIL